MDDSKFKIISISFYEYDTTRPRDIQTSIISDAQLVNFESKL